MHQHLSVLCWRGEAAPPFFLPFKSSGPQSCCVMHREVCQSKTSRNRCPKRCTIAACLLICWNQVPHSHSVESFHFQTPPPPLPQALLDDDLLTLCWCTVEQGLTFVPGVVLVQWLLVQLPLWTVTVPSPQASYWKSRQLSHCVQYFFSLSPQEQSVAESAIQTFHTGSVWGKKRLHLSPSACMLLNHATCFTVVSCLRAPAVYLGMWPCATLRPSRSLCIVWYQLSCAEEMNTNWF